MVVIRTRGAWVLTVALNHCCTAPLLNETKLLRASLSAVTVTLTGYKPRGHVITLFTDLIYLLPKRSFKSETIKYRDLLRF